MINELQQVWHSRETKEEKTLVTVKKVSDKLFQTAERKACFAVTCYPRGQIPGILYFLQEISKRHPQPRHSAGGRGRRTFWKLLGKLQVTQPSSPKIHLVDKLAAIANLPLLSRWEHLTATRQNGKSINNILAHSSALSGTGDKLYRDY